MCIKINRCDYIINGKCSCDTYNMARQFKSEKDIKCSKKNNIYITIGFKKEKNSIA